MSDNTLHAILYDNPNVDVEEVQAVIDKYPEAVKEKNRDDRLPLHYAARNGVSKEVIKLLINKYPGAVKEDDERGYLPLHYAARKGVSVEVITLLIDEKPDAVKKGDDFGRLPLHHAARKGVSVEVINLLIDKYSDAVKKKDKDGCLPLHYAANKEAEVKVIKLLIEKYPDAVKDKNSFGDLPLHYALWTGASDEMIELLVKKFPYAAKEKDKLGYLPLHIAIKENASVEVVQLLANEYPDAVKKKDGDGHLPLRWAIKQGMSAVVIQLIDVHPDAAKEKDKLVYKSLLFAIKESASVEVIQLLVNEYPDAVKEKDRDGHLPLHRAIDQGVSAEVIQLLIKKNPNAVMVKDGDGYPPLHKAFDQGVSDEMIQLLFKEYQLIGMYSDAVKETDEFGNLPLHHAVEKKASVEVIQLLIKEYPDAVKERDKNGNLPLHRAVRSDASHKVIRLLVNEYPDAVEAKDILGTLPLHIAVRFGASDEVIKLLITKYPDAAKKKVIWAGTLPLHTAIEKGASDKVIQLLVNEYPDAVKETDKFGNLPLHHAVEKKAPVDGLQLLIEEYPDAVKKRDKKRNLPLHTAVRFGASAEVIQLLVKEYPDAVKENDKDGNLPLHCAVEKEASAEIIRLLIEEYPDAAKVKDNDGDLPLHRAVAKGASVESIQLILNAHPQAAKERMKDERLPIEVYLKNEGGDLVLALLKADMPVAIEDGMPVEHSGSWTTCVSSNIKIATAAVRQVLSNEEGGAGFGKYIHVLADVHDAEGRTALAAASSGARTEIYKYLLFCSRYKLHMGPTEHLSGTSAVFRAQDFANYEVIFDKADKNEDGNLDKKELNAIAESNGLDPDLFLTGSDKMTISKAEFIATCKRQLGDGPREVVIKFMENKDHWEREIKARADYKLNPKYVVSALSNIPTETEIAEAVERGDGGLVAIKEKFLNGIKPGKYAIIMNAAERNLHQILYQEEPEIDAKRDMLRQVFEAVQHLHDQGLMHGDLKMVNIVRFRNDNKLRLIDLDASARMAQIGEEEDSFAGSKVSSAILPPEMIQRIVTKEELEKFDEYWKAENDKDLYEKVKPKPCKERGVLKAHYVVKSFRTKDGQPVHNGLPYKLVRASESIDAWSLGVLAFTLLTGKTLIPSTFVDDCASGAAMDVLYSWGKRPEVLSEVIKKIHDDAARDLVRQLLQYEPGKRPTVAYLLKTHPFFNLQSVDVLKGLEDIKTSVKDEICHLSQVMMKGIFEATEVVAPTTFTILNEKLPLAQSIEKAKNQILDMIAAEDECGVNLEAENASLVTISAEGAEVDIPLEGDLKEHDEKVKAGMKWVTRINEIGSKVAAGEVGKAFDIIKEGIKELIVGEEMYLYLIDELTGKPVQADGWPLIITKPSELVPKLVPLMQLGLRGLSITNGVAGVALFFGFPVPAVPKDIIKGAQESIEVLKKESSVKEFGVVHEAVKGGGGEQKTVRGASLREFLDFLKMNDPGLKEGKNGDFAGLQRIGDPEDGTALWTALADPKDREIALKERAKQRKVEQMKHDEYMRKEEQLKHNKYTKETVQEEIVSEGAEGSGVENLDLQESLTVGTTISLNKGNRSMRKRKVAADENEKNRFIDSSSKDVATSADAEAVSAAGNACCAIM